MFFYSDQSIFDKVKRNKTREKLVNWAEDFFKPYDLTLNSYPLSWSESTYRKLFCLDQTGGLKGMSLNPIVKQIIENSIEIQRLNVLSSFDAADQTSPAVLETMKIEFNRVADLMKEYTRFLSLITDQEHLFRLKVQDAIKKQMSLSAIKETFVQIVFCDFYKTLQEASPILNSISKIDSTVKSIGDDTVAMTLSMEIDKLLLYTEKSKKGIYDYLHPIVLIDVNAITKSMNYVLAHELVHVAGGTRDIQGSKGSIMNYVDAQGKAPSAVTLEEADKKKLETAFFTG